MQLAVRSVRLLVTGASGFVGGWLLRRLAPQAEGRALEIFPFGGASDAYPAFDITDAAQVEREVRRVRPTSVVHLAGIAAPRQAQDDPRLAWEVNVMGTLHLARAVLEHAPDARFVFAGSSEVYGRSFLNGGQPLREDAALDPITSYGATKAAADLLLGQMAHDGLRAVRFRPFNHSGPGQEPLYVVSALAKQVADIERGAQPPVIRVGNLATERDFLDVRDVADAYAEAALGAPAVEPGTVINLASGTLRSIRSILDILVAASTAPIEVQVDPALVRANDLPCAVGDASRAQELLGWSPRVPFRQTVEDVLEFWRGRA